MNLLNLEDKIIYSNMNRYELIVKYMYCEQHLNSRLKHVLCLGYFPILHKKLSKLITFFLPNFNYIKNYTNSEQINKHLHCTEQCLDHLKGTFIADLLKMVLLQPIHHSINISHEVIFLQDIQSCKLLFQQKLNFLHCSFNKFPRYQKSKFFLSTMSLVEIFCWKSSKIFGFCLLLNINFLNLFE